MHGYPVLGLSFGSKAKTLGRALIIHLIAAVSLVSDLCLLSPAFAQDQNGVVLKGCSDQAVDRHGDPEILAEAQALAVLLLDGQPSFYKKESDEVAKLRAGPYPSTKEVDLVLDLMCFDPQDVHAGAIPGGKFQYTVDGWRIKVNEAIGSIFNTTEAKDLPDTLTRVQKDINGIPEDDRPSFVADFNRTVAHPTQPFPFRARLKPDNSIEIFQTQ